jgi:uncharacterized protein
MVPILAFLFGLGGSLHCVGMCGGLASSCATDRPSNLFYQLGRLISYSFLGIFSGFLGHLFRQIEINPFLAALPAFLIGFLFIFWGIQTLRRKSYSLQFPILIQKGLKQLWPWAYSQNSPILKSFTIGLISIFLPCALLYGAVLALSTFQSPLHGIIGMISFWLGTLPAMMLVPEIIKKVLTPFRKRSPLLASLILIIIGITTITLRMVTWYETQGASCH